MPILGGFMDGEHADIPRQISAAPNPFHLNYQPKPEAEFFDHGRPDESFEVRREAYVLVKWEQPLVDGQAVRVCYMEQGMADKTQRGAFAPLPAAPPTPHPNLERRTHG